MEEFLAAALARAACLLAGALMVRLYGASARSARARRTYDRVMTDRP